MQPHDVAWKDMWYNPVHIMREQEITALWHKIIQDKIITVASATVPTLSKSPNLGLSWIVIMLYHF